MMDLYLRPAMQNEPPLVSMHCPLCGSAAITPFLRRNRVPVLANLLLESQEEARRVQRGNLHLTVCRTCGFIFNSAFKAAARYTERYENSQAHAPTFRHYLDALVSSLVKDPQIQCGHIVEIGCGDGSFIHRLIEAGSGNTGIGFDPAYRGPTSTLDGRLQFVPRYYDETCGDRVADVILCRHVLEHVHRPIPFLCLLHQAVAASPHVRLFFETPDVAWIFRHTVIWDLYYEHCSYFRAETLTVALELAGFQVQRIQRTFGEQYLWVEATIRDAGYAPPFLCNPGSIPSLAFQFQRSEQHFCQEWRRTIEALSQDGPVALLGAAGKGVTLANLVDPDARLISCIVDLNPQKQHKFLPGTGHPIVSYEEMKTYGITSAIVLNPNYYEDTIRLLDHHQISVRLVVDPIGPLLLPPDTSSKQKAALERLSALVEHARLAGKTIVFTNGIFDLLHAGHVQFLRYAKTLGDVLIVAVDSDASARHLKGPGRPINNERDRLMLIAALDMVDAALIFEGETLPELIRTLRPHLYVKGGDYRGKASPASDVLDALRVQSIIAPLFHENLHTSQLIERILTLAPST